MKLSLIIFLMFCIVTVTNSQWYEQTFPDSIFLNSVFMVDENIAFAVGNGVEQYLIKTTDGGSTWNYLPFFSKVVFHSVYFLNSDTGFIGGQFGLISKTTDGGFSWETLSMGTNQVILDIDFVDDSTGFACGTGGFLYKTTNGGTTWETIQLNSHSFSALDFLDAETGFLIGSTSLKTTDGGSSWQEMSFQSSPSDIFMIDAQIGFVTKYNLTYGGGIYKTIDGGNTWLLYSSTISEPLSSIFFTSPDTGYACGGWYSPQYGPSSYIVKTTNGGDSWFEQDTEFGYDLLSIHFGSKLKGMAVGRGLVGTDNEGEVTAVNELNLNTPSDFMLFQNYPNPFNPSTKIKYGIPSHGGQSSNGKSEMASVELAIFDLLGREVAVLVNEDQKPGYYEVQFNAPGLSSGIYFYRLKTGNNFVKTKKMILLR